MLFLGVILYAWIRIPKERFYLPLLTLATVLAAGALGNFIDRFFRGDVIEFIYFSLIDFPVFNLADIYVVASGILDVYKRQVLETEPFYVAAVRDAYGRDLDEIITDVPEIREVIQGYLEEISPELKEKLRFYQDVYKRQPNKLRSSYLVMSK